MNKVEFVMVTGMSGAGKTSCMAVMENLEFKCMDNFPLELLPQFTDLIKKDLRYDKVAYAVSLQDAMQTSEILSKLDWIELSILFLDAEDDVLLKRYKQTRRTHPLLISEKVSTLTEAIKLEREYAQPVIKISNNTIDTSMIKVNKLQEILEVYYNSIPFEPFRITFMSFGYKHGIPKDLDLMFDVRFLPNPFYNVDLREKTGNDQDVYDFVMTKPETAEFLEHIIPTLEYLLNKFEKEGRMHLVIGIGCTGGQHRSVSLTNYFADYFSKKYLVYKLHRDATR